MNNENKGDSKKLSNKLGLDYRVLVDVVSGSTSGAVTRFFVAPLDVVKIRLQLQHTSKKPQGLNTTLKAPPKYRGVLQSLSLIVREEGVRALWRGNLSAEMLWITYGCVQFTTYHLAVRAFTENNTTPTTPLIALSSGGLAGIVSTVLSYPFDIARTHLIQNEGDKKTLSATLKHLAAPGPRALFRGLPPALLQIVPQMSLQFMFYEGSLAVADSAALPKSSTLLFTCGAIAGMGSKLLVLPFDVVKKRVQVNDSHSILACISELYSKEGPSSFFKGVSPSLLKAGLASALSFLFYERCKELIQSQLK